MSLKMRILKSCIELDIRHWLLYQVKRRMGRCVYIIFWKNSLLMLCWLEQVMAKDGRDLPSKEVNSLIKVVSRWKHKKKKILHGRMKHTGWNNESTVMRLLRIRRLRHLWNDKKWSCSWWTMKWKGRFLEECSIKGYLIFPALLCFTLHKIWRILIADIAKDISGADIKSTSTERKNMCLLSLRVSLISV